MNKLHVMIISDIALLNSGVAIQTKYIIDGLLKKFPGKYKFTQLGVAINHPDNRWIKTDTWGDDCIIVPTKGYFDAGDTNKKMYLRSMLQQFRPDVLVLFNDPRFFWGLFEMADEIYTHIPIIYNHLWDSPPKPQYNRPYYESCNAIVALNKQTYNWLKEDGYNVSYIPHALDYKIFKPNNSESSSLDLKQKIFGKDKLNHKVFFYNSRNARRKLTSHLINVFNQWWLTLPNRDACLLLHSRPDDPEGGNLEVQLQDLHPELKASGCVKFSIDNIEPQIMAEFYNMADATVNPSLHEGVGLSCMESLACGTPAIAPEHGGLQDQIWDPETGKEWGVKVPVKLQTLTGAQPIPYIYENYYLTEDLIAAFQKIYSMPRTEIKQLGLEASEWVRQKFNMDFLIDSWDQVLTQTLQQHQTNPYKFEFMEI